MLRRRISVHREVLPKTKTGWDDRPFLISNPACLASRQNAGFRRSSTLYFRNTTGRTMVSVQRAVLRREIRAGLKYNWVRNHDTSSVLTATTCAIESRLRLSCPRMEAACGIPDHGRFRTHKIWRHWIISSPPSRIYRLKQRLCYLLLKSTEPENRSNLASRFLRAVAQSHPPGLAKPIVLGDTLHAWSKEIVAICAALATTASPEAFIPKWRSHSGRLIFRHEEHSSDQLHDRVPKRDQF
jgi:hypothetical protein